MLNTLSVILLILSGLIFYFYINPMYAGESTEKGQESIKQLIKINEKINLKNDKVRELSKKYDELSNRLINMNAKYHDEILKTKLMIPYDVENAKIIDYIHNIIQSNSNIAGNISNIEIISNNPNKKGGKVSKNEIKIETNKDGYSSINLSFTFTGTYEGIKKFIDDLYHSLRIFDIVSLSIKPTKANSNGDIGNVDFYDVTIVVRTY